MRSLVIYYSLTGTTRAVAAALAKELGADVEEIHCTHYAPGIWGALRAGYDSVRGKLPAIAPLVRNSSSYELVVIGGPIWASHPATPVRAYLQQEEARRSTVAFFLTHGGSAAEPALREMERLAQRQPKATLVVRAADVKSGTFASAGASFATALRKASGTA
jgi:flavodoxin